MLCLEGVDLAITNGLAGLESAKGRLSLEAGRPLGKLIDYISVHVFTARKHDITLTHNLGPGYVTFFRQ